MLADFAKVKKADSFRIPFHQLNYFFDLCHNNNDTTIDTIIQAFSEFLQFTFMGNIYFLR